MKHLLSLSIILFAFASNAQETYSEMTEKGTKTVNTEDVKNYDIALTLFEKAFNKFPDSIRGNDLYYASILAAELKNSDTAFKYLTPLTEMEKDEDGYPGWSNVLGEYAKEDYKNLLNDTRWEVLKKKAIIKRDRYFKKLQLAEQEFFTTANTKLDPNLKAKKLYQQIKNYTPYIEKKERDYSISFKINDTTTTSYVVHLPKDYNPKKRYPAILYLHGGVRFASLEAYQIISQALGGHRRFYTKHAAINDVILVFPSGSKKYNWMTNDDGFFIVPKIVEQLKSTINLNDDKIFVSGHSNGATGTFSYLMKQPTKFAGFYGFNTEPKVYTGGTFIENILNRSFSNFSTDQDYYYPPNANDRLNKLMDSIKADYKDHRYIGFPHWFPEYDESEPAHKIVFDDVMKRERNPFPQHITWEFDDDKNGNIDWLTAIKLDTTRQKANWHQNKNFKIDKWLKFKNRDSDSLIEVDVAKNAFDFPRKSGKIIAEYQDNVFNIKTSQINSFNINISPEMVHLKKKILIYVNGKLYFKKKVTYDKAFMLRNFEKNRDRSQIWVHTIAIEL